ncbi:MAG: response regulator transcription factor [Lachnospiraceae bacterium]|nr:response regulator transcription factor [Lachnospiraceae bacterium]MDD3794934.1 response regulator transcription factor [Lachnospiraceae bacterium]
MKTKLLVIEDDTALAELMCMNLEAAGYEVIYACDGEAAVLLMQQHGDIALALADIMLPGRDGFSLMEEFRWRKLPIIYLTAKGDVASKVKGLKIGAEDYMVKPVEVLELLVRIEKVLERTGRARKAQEIGNVKVDLKRHQVYKNGEMVRLKPMEYELLVLLLQNRNVAVSREYILNHVWGTDFMGETRTVDVHIGQLRKKLGLGEAIKTIPKLGYRLEENE